MSSPYKHGALIELPGGMRAYVDGIPDDCNHDYSEPVFQTKSGKWIFWYTYRQWASLTSTARNDLINQLHGPGGEHEDDPILVMTSQCTKCKKIYEPNFFTEEF